MHIYLEKNDELFSKYDEETHERYTLEMYNADDAAENGEEASCTKKVSFMNLPSMDKIKEVIGNAGCNTFEITHTVEKVERYERKT